MTLHAVYDLSQNRFRHVEVTDTGGAESLLRCAPAVSESCLTRPTFWTVSLSTHEQVANVFSRRPSQDTGAKFRTARNQAFATWAQVTGVAMAA